MAKIMFKCSTQVLDLIISLPVMAKPAHDFQLIDWALKLTVTVKISWHIMCEELYVGVE